MILKEEENDKLNSNKDFDRKDYINGSKILVNLYINEIIFIHFNEFFIFCIKKEFNEGIYLSLIHLKILIGYFNWKEEQKVN